MGKRELPFPWRVEYRRLVPEWHPKSSPEIVAANGELVVDIPQTVDHPGEYDQQADELAQSIVETMNFRFGPLIGSEQ